MPRRCRTATRLATCGLALILFVSLAGPATAATMTWTDQGDFEAGTVTDLDSSISPGDLRLVRDPDLWVKSPTSPVLELGPYGAWDSQTLTSVNVMVDEGVLKMWYAACGPGGCALGYATSADGISWTRHASNPVLVGDPTGWDASISNPTVIKDGGLFHLWYAGNNFGQIQIGYATSPDGIAWTKEPSNPVLIASGTSWDSATVSTPVVLQEGVSFTMWYSGHGGDYVYRTGRATSPDGVNWTRDPMNPLLVPTGAWEESRIHPMQVLVSGGNYELYYFAAYYYVQIGHAVSLDGRSWTRSPASPILSPGSYTSWDASSLGVCTVVDIAGERVMWYSGSDGSARRIGRAVRGAYRSTGHFLSEVVDSGDLWTTWDALAGDIDLPPLTIVVLGARSGQTPIPDGSWSTWSVSNGTGDLLQPPLTGEYGQVMATLVSTDASVTPVVHEIRLSYTPPPPPGPNYTVIFFVGGSIGVVVGGVVATYFVIRRSRRLEGEGPPPPPSQ